MKTTKQLIESLEKVTGKKVKLKENTNITDSEIAGNIPGVSKTLNKQIKTVLEYYEYEQAKRYGDNIRFETLAEKTIIDLKRLGLIGEDGEWVEPELLVGELKIAAKWLKDNV